MKGKRDIKLIALDIDGTLITKDHQISKKTKKAIEKALSRGVNVMLSTGRPPEKCHNYCDELKLTSYLITASGGEIWSPHGEIFERHLHEAELVQTLFKMGSELELNMWLISTTKVFENGIYPDDFNAYDWLKIGFFSDDAAKLTEMKHKLADYTGIEITNSHPTNIEVNPEGVSKAAALIKVCKELGIRMDQVMAVGDSLNDYTMIEQSGLGIAMGNAQPEIKQIADFITESNEEDGVAVAIEKFVLNE